MLDVANKLSQFFGCKQDIDKGTSTYVDETKAQFDVLQTAGIKIVSDDMIKHTLSKLDTRTTYTAYEAIKTAARKVTDDEGGQILLSTVIMNKTHPKNHQNVAGALHGTFSLGTNAYPTTTPKALELLHYGNNPNNPNNGGSQSSGNWNSNTGPNNLTQKDSATNQTSLTIKGVETNPDDTDTHQILMAGVEEGQFNDEFCFVLCAMNISQTTDSLLTIEPLCPDCYSEDVFGKGLTCMIIRIDVYTIDDINQVIPNTVKATLMHCVNTIIGVYAGQGIIVTQVFGDNEFNCLKMNLIMKTPPAYKEQVQCIFAAVLFKTLPPCIVIELVNGFDDYVLGHGDTGNNLMNPRARDAIFLQPTVEAIAIKQKSPNSVTYGDMKGDTTILDLDTGSLFKPDDDNTIDSNL
eukprot:jgi/Psemu1/31731/gm1.31731_g